MHALDSASRTNPCRSCGAYGNSQHQFSCQPGRSVTQGPMPRAARDRHTSAAIREYARVEDSLIRQLGAGAVRSHGKEDCGDATAITVRPDGRA